MRGFMTVVAIINQKGGVGKTTVATNLAYALSKKMTDTPVMLIDLDPQAHTSLIYRDPDKCDYFINNLFLNKEETVFAFPATNKKDDSSITNLIILPSNLQLAVIAEQLSGRVHREKLLHNHLKKLNKDRIIIVDCPPNLGLLAINGIYAAQEIIIPVNYGRYALEGMKDLLDVIKEIKENDEYTYKILRNSFDTRNSQTNKFIERQLSLLEDKLIKTKIRKCESLNQAQINEESIYTFDPKSNGVEDFDSLCDELLEE